MTNVFSVGKGLAVLAAALMGVSLASQAPPAAAQPSPAAQAAAIPFRWEAGEHYALRWTAEHRLVNSVYSIQTGNEEPIFGTNLPSLETEEKRTLRDWCQAVDAQRPLRLRRNIDKAQLSGKLDFGESVGEPVEVTLESPLTGRETSVQFTYIPKTGEYGRYYDRNAGGEERLRGMRLDLDYAGWKPRGEVGQEWTLPVAELLPVLSPGGAMHYAGGTPEVSILVRSMKLGFGGSWETWFTGKQNPNAPLRGTIQAKFDRIMESPLGPEAHITFSFELQNSLDQLDTARATRRRVERFDGMNITRAEVGIQAHGTGRIIWDVNQGRVKGIDLDGAETLTLDLQWQKGEEPITTELSEYRGNFEVNAYLLADPDGDEGQSWTVRPDPQTDGAEESASEEPQESPDPSGDDR